MKAKFLFFLFIVLNTTAQVGIGTASPDADSLLEISSTNKGFLPPRIALIQTSNAAPLSAHVAGMIVYNTATINDVIPGLYQNDGTKWSKLGLIPSTSLGLNVGESFSYSGSIPFNSWINLHYLDEYAGVISTLPALPVLDGLTLDAQLQGPNSLYAPLFKNVSGSPKSYNFISKASIDFYTSGMNLTLSNNSYQSIFDYVYLNTINGEYVQLDLDINSKWYRIVYFLTLDAATALGKYTIRISIIRMQ